jgi:hypothetical protein
VKIEANLQPILVPFIISIGYLRQTPMTMTSMKPAILATVLALLVADSQAWTSSMKSASISKARTFGSAALRMAEEEEQSQDGVQLTSVSGKEIKFDEKAGRFFETRLEASECIPEEEFCTIDDTTGKKIRLTVAEKERIFLDALQVGIFHGLSAFIFY